MNYQIFAFKDIIVPIIHFAGFINLILICVSYFVTYIVYIVYIIVIHILWSFAYSRKSIRNTFVSFKGRASNYLLLCCEYLLIYVCVDSI